jgi:hypothetical protein
LKAFRPDVKDNGCKDPNNHEGDFSPEGVTLPVIGHLVLDDYGGYNDELDYDILLK